MKQVRNVLELIMMFAIIALIITAIVYLNVLLATYATLYYVYYVIALNLVITIGLANEIHKRINDAIKDEDISEALERIEKRSKESL